MGFFKLVNRSVGLLGAAALLAALAPEAGAVDKWAGPIPHASSYGDEVDKLYWLIYGIVAVVFVGVQATLVYFLIKYRAKPGDTRKVIYSHGSNTLEVIWTATPAMILLFIGLVQRSAWMQIKNSFPSDDDPRAIRIEGRAARFNWNFVYAGKDGKFDTSDDVNSPVLIVPVDHKIVLQMRSKDVLHSFFLPHFRVKQDIVPGLTIPIWFEPTMTTIEYATAHQYPLVGDMEFYFEIACAELCGNSHFSMKGRMNVVTRTEYDTWLRDNDPATKFTGGDVKAWRDQRTAENKKLAELTEEVHDAEQIEKYNEALAIVARAPKQPANIKDKPAMAKYQEELEAYLGGLSAEERKSYDESKVVVDEYTSKVATIEALESTRWAWKWTELKMTKEFFQK